MRYRKKPIEINAEEYKPGMEDGFIYSIPPFGLFNKDECIKSGFTPDFEKDKIPYIDTMEGKMLIRDGDYIITGIEGERYPCKPDIFHKTYEPVDGEEVELPEAMA